MKSISIIGYGWLGKACAEYLYAQSYAVKVTNRNAGIVGLSYPIFAWKLGEQFPVEASSDVVIISIAENENHLEHYHELYRDLEKYGVQKIIFISSTSIYNGMVGEVSETDEILLKESSVARKESTLNNTELDFVILRLSGLVGPNRNPARFLAGKKNVANPNNKINLVHQTDVIRFIEQCIQQDVLGVFNVCSSEHPTREEFYTKVCLHQSLEAPLFAIDTEETRWVNNAKSKSELNFEYQYDNLLEYYTKSEASE
jgi:nucleoside-diphosphate-sugar epimerase